MKSRLFLILMLWSVAAGLAWAATAEVMVDRPEAGTKWGSNSPNNPIVTTLEPEGGPQGAPCRAFTYKQGGEGWLPFTSPTLLRPGTKLSFWLKGNGTKDQIRLFVNSAPGYRGYDLGFRPVLAPGQ